MKNITVLTQPNYNVTVASGIIKLLKDIKSNYNKTVVISDDVVFKLYGNLIDCDAQYCIKHGEKSKNLATYADVLNFLASQNLTRSDLIIAFGGGVVGDLAGFAAATYLRGVDYVQIPTSLLAMLDSSVGGKTAVDLPLGKNLVGAFYQPKAVLCDIDFLKTLPHSEMLNGMGEAIKYGAIFDKKLFEELQKNGLSNPIDIISRCVELKADVVARDTFDKGDRALLNFGHTLAHAIEKHSAYNIPHGVAVGIGMYLITDLSEKLSLSQSGTANSIAAALQNNKMPYTYDEASVYELFCLAANDKKRSGNDISLVYAEKIGKGKILKASYDELCDTIKNIYG